MFPWRISMHLLSWTTAFSSFSTETADYAGIIETSEGAKARALCLMLMCVQKLRILNKFGRRGRRRQTEFLIRRTEVQRVESLVKMEKKEAKLRSKSGQI
uniref:Secreted protein n=1 Tax=Populus trichocarpa TaxID=3694 RepID=A0A3N7F5F0_POPTR